VTTYLTGREIGQAERALQGLLSGVLEGTPLVSAEHWVALTAVANEAEPASTARVAEVMRRRESVVSATLADLRAAGLLTDDAGWSPTASGRALHDDVSTKIEALRERINDGLDPQDVAVTQRVLTLVAERAAALAAT
jgi:DNA-binding MarR family transcriptional regulator